MKDPGVDAEDRLESWSVVYNKSWTGAYSLLQ